ncbi:MAG: hypothetical protein VYA30_05280 [Myxococcota bacterium]|nr:hypothetical protein [Myxococcota bacterium]
MNQSAAIAVFVFGELVFGLWPILRYGFPAEAIARAAIFMAPWVWWYGHRKNIPLITIMVVPTFWLVGTAHLLVDGLSGLDVLVATLTMSAYVLIMMLSTPQSVTTMQADEPIVWTPTEQVHETVTTDGRIITSIFVMLLCLAPLYAGDLLLTDDVLGIWSNQGHRVQACTILLLSLQGAFAVDTLLDTHFSSPRRHRGRWLLVTSVSLTLGVAWSV